MGLQLISFAPGMTNPLATWAMGKDVGEPPAVPAAAEPAPEPAEVVITPADTPVKPSKRRRAHAADGQFQGDNPATPEVNEAWEAGNPEA